MPRDGFNIYAPPAGTLATPGTPIESAKYNAFVNDLTADANAPRPIVAGGTGATTAAAARTALGVQASSPALTSIAALSTAADKGIYTTAANTYATFDLTAAGRALLDDADAAAQRTTLGAQAASDTLTSLSGVALQAGDLLYATGANALAGLAKGTNGQVLSLASGIPAWTDAPGWTFANQTTASGSVPVDFNVPTSAQEIIVEFEGTDRATSTADFLVRLGTSSAFEATGYAQISSIASVSGDAGATAFAVKCGAAGAARGSMRLVRMSSVKWQSSHSVAHSTTRIASGGGTKTLADVLTRVRVLPSAGDWAGGSISVGYR